MMLGRPRESARLGAAGLEVVRPYGVDSTVLVANRIEALVAVGEWDEATRRARPRSAPSPRTIPYMPSCIRAELEVGRGDFDAARAHLEAARHAAPRPRPGDLRRLPRGARPVGAPLDRGRRGGADGLARASSREAAQLRVWLCAKGLRAQAELAALARARQDATPSARWLDRARS